jgi:uncharacterized membrane protein YraQ (UPF0718 family)
MSGNWRVNAILGIIAFLLTYLFSFVNNTWLTSSFRAGIGFLIFFVLGFFLRFLLKHQLVSKNNTGLIQKQNVGEEFSPKVEQEKKIDEEALDDPLFLALPLHSLHKGNDV